MSPFIILIVFFVNSAYGNYQNQNAQISQADLQPMNLPISNAAEAIVVGKKKNNDTFGGTVHLFQFNDGKLRPSVCVGVI